jgi:hypothetical protein
MPGMASSAMFDSANIRVIAEPSMGISFPHVDIETEGPQAICLIRTFIAKDGVR